MNRRIKGLLFGVCLGLSSAFFALTPLGIALEDNFGLPWLFKVRGPIEPPSEVVVVGLDKRSADTLMLPPDASHPRDWPRSLHGQLIENLVQGGASFIVFDIAFKRARSIDPDTEFATAIARSCRVLLLTTVEREVSRQAIKEIWPIQPFVEAALAVAPFPLPKEPAKVSQFWAFFLGADHMPTLPVVAFQAYALEALEESPDLLRKAGLPEVKRSKQDALCPAAAHDLRESVHTFRRAFKEDPDAGRRFIQFLNAKRQEHFADEDWQRHLRVLSAFVQLYQGPENRYLNFYGPPGTIPTIPYHALISSERASGDEDTADVAGKVVFVGYSEQTVPTKDDSYYTVFTKDGIDLSGVEIAATAFANLLTGRVLKPTDPLTTAAILLVFGAVIGGLSCVLPAMIAVPSVVALAVAYTLGAQLLFNTANLWMPLATPLFVELPLALLIGLLSQYVSAQHQRTRMQRAISHYVPPRVAQELADHPVDPISVKESVYATCLAADAENFTSLAEGMTPDAAASYLNKYFDALAEAMHQHQADVVKFHVDGVMYAWTANRPDPAVRARACLAALTAVEAVDTFNTRCPPLCLEIGVGLHAGSVFLGHVGGGGHFGFEVVGDIANTAVRIEELNKQLGTRLLASEAVVADLDDFLFRPLGAFLLKGKKNAVSVAEIMAPKDRASMAQMSLCGRFAGALAAFKGHRWQEATQQFEAILANHPDDGPSRFYLKNCRSRKKSDRPRP